jgi:uncharacterized membrane protein
MPDLSTRAKPAVARGTIRGHSDRMEKGRLEAFSDGVIAIIITIMVLELKVERTDGADFAALRDLLSEFLSYVLSFVYVGIYWNNHHHMFQLVERTNGAILWANLHLLFWLSLVPFTTAWMGRNPFAPVPTALYGVVLLMAAMTYLVLQRAIIREHGPDSLLAKAMGRDLKGNASPVIYLVAIGLAFVNSGISYALYALVALIWLVPDRRIERVVVSQKRQN